MRDQGSGFQSSGFRVQGSGFRVQGLGVRVQGSGFRVQGSGFRVWSLGFRVWGAGFLGMASPPSLPIRDERARERNRPAPRHSCCGASPGLGIRV